MKKEAKKKGTPKAAAAAVVGAKKVSDSTGVVKTLGGWRAPTSPAKLDLFNATVQKYNQCIASSTPGLARHSVTPGQIVRRNIVARPTPAASLEPRGSPSDPAHCN